MGATQTGAPVAPFTTSSRVQPTRRGARAPFVTAERHHEPLQRACHRGGRRRG